jgi:Capsule biosynthesis CapC
MIPQVIQIFETQRLTVLLHASIFIGVHVVALMNVSFGWVLSGLVVPGLLAPLIISSPLAAGLIFFEAILAFALFKLYSYLLEKLNLSSSPFGRERFFGIVLFSVIARCFVEGIFFPMATSVAPSLAHWTEFHTYLKLKGNLPPILSSSSIVLTALLANQFWKPGIFRGIKQSLITTAISTCILYFILQKWFHFPTEQLVLFFSENVESIFSSPGKYVVILICAYLASQINASFGWDFSGILLPSLLALSVLSPRLIGITFLETSFILAGVGLILKTPLFAKLNIEGAYRLLLYFNLSLLLKLVFIFVCQLFFPQLKFDEFMSVGFLLATLLAMKSQEKKLGFKIFSATTLASCTGLFCSFGVAFLIGKLFPIQSSIEKFAQLEVSKPEKRPQLVSHNLSDAEEINSQNLSSVNKNYASINVSTAYGYLLDRTQRFKNINHHSGFFENDVNFSYLIESFDKLFQYEFWPTKQQQFEINRLFSQVCIRSVFFEQEKILIISQDIKLNTATNCSSVKPGVLVISYQEKPNMVLQAYNIAQKTGNINYHLKSKSFLVLNAWKNFNSSRSKALWFNESEVSLQSKISPYFNVWKEQNSSHGKNLSTAFALSWNKYFPPLNVVAEKELSEVTENFISPEYPTIVSLQWGKDSPGDVRLVNSTLPKNIAKNYLRPDECNLFPSNCTAVFNNNYTYFYLNAIQKILLTQGVKLQIEESFSCNPHLKFGNSPALKKLVSLMLPSKPNEFGKEFSVSLNSPRISFVLEQIKNQGGRLALTQTSLGIPLGLSFNDKPFIDFLAEEACTL